MKISYISAWILLAAAAFFSVLTGTLNAVALVAFSFIALGLIYALALWLVTTNTREIKSG